MADELFEFPIAICFHYFCTWLKIGTRWRSLDWHSKLWTLFNIYAPTVFILVTNQVVIEQWLKYVLIVFIFEQNDSLNP